MSAAASSSAGDFVKPDKRHTFFALYLTAILLTSAIRAPFAGFDGVPFYVLLTPFVLFLQGPRAIAAAVTFALALFTYEFCKNFQPDYQETVKSIIGILAFSALLSTVYYALITVLRCPPGFIGNWLGLTLALEFAAIVIDLGLGALGLWHSGFHHFFLPIKSYSGFFSEPSHVGMFVAPFIFMFIFDNRTYRRYLGRTGTISLLGIVLLCSSTTEFAAIALAVAALVCKQASHGKFLNLLVVGLTAAALGAAALSIRKVAARVVGLIAAKSLLSATNSEAALSILAFFKGAEMARYALLHMPLGVAFLDMAALNVHSRVNDISKLLHDINSSDGSSIFFKGICEFGYLFLVFVAIAVFKNVVHIGRYNRNDPRALQNLLFLGLEFSIFTIFIRSGSYFQSIVPIAIAALLLPRPKQILAPRRRPMPAAGIAASLEPSPTS